MHDIRRSKGYSRPKLRTTGSQSKTYQFLGEWCARCVPDADLVSKLGISRRCANDVAFCALVNDTDVTEEILSSGMIDEAAYYRKLANHLDLSFEPTLEGYKLHFDLRDKSALHPAKFQVRIGYARKGLEANLVLLAPKSIDKASLEKFRSRYPDVSRRLRIVAPSSLRQAIISENESAILNRAIDDLSNSAPGLSAKTVATAWQGAVLGGLLIAIPILFYFFPVATSLGLHAFFSTVFLASIALRTAAAHYGSFERQKCLSEVTPAAMPIYSVLVPIYKEAGIVPDLLAALERIVWPRPKLEIKIICESDDDETIHAVSEHKLRPWIELVVVPAAEPRTKPKALNYASVLTSGDFVTIYDAEDRPHPYQLMEAWQRFRSDDDSLACLQAPLVIANYRTNILCRMFAVEYAALFRGLLPWLASRDYLLPLGGTSNHFRRAALENVGWWDPYNVTEDADLGIRLFRYGYRVGTITRPTLEEAPENMNDWLAQRSRWYKGWLQTWLVHNRSPRLVMKQIGLKSWLIGQAMMSGLVISALAHPFILSTLIILMSNILSIEQLSPAQSLLLVIDATNVVLAYGAFLVLARKTLTKAERQSFWKVVLMTPVYWLAMSAGAWRALWQLTRKPHHWDKTPHPPRTKDKPSIKS